jgi:hypothetical protein
MEIIMENRFNSPEERQKIISALVTGPTKITFLKKDGTERVMNCTLKSDLTEDYEKKTDRVKESNPDVCPVFDLDLKAWRSFRFDSVRAVEFGL